MNLEFIIEDKIDGLSIDLEYDNGYLIKAITRGDGFFGEDILNNVIKMKNIKKNINGFNGSIRGEIVLCKNDFLNLNKLMRNNKQKEFVNPRNAASGIAKRLDSKYSEYLSIFYYDVTGNFDKEKDKMLWLESNELKTCFWKVCNKSDSIDIYNNYEKDLRNKCVYDVDGLVLKINDCKINHILGNTSEGNPIGHVAWKFSAMKAETTLENIEWQIGKSGRVTAVAILKPVYLAGVTISKASLHNLEIFNKLNLTKGDKVLISRRNDVVPYLESVISKGNLGEFTVPTHCEICKEPLQNDGVFLTCTNESCDGNKLGNLKKWIKTLGLKGIADATIEQLYESNIIDTPEDFYKLSEDDFLGLEGFGKRKIEKFLETIYGKMEISFGELIGGLNIAGISVKTAELLYSNEYKDINVIAEAKKEDLTKIIGIGDLSAQAIIDGFNNKIEQINALFDVGIKIKVDEVVEGGILAGKKVVFTGEITITREEAQALVKKNGGTCPSGISKEVDFLVCADPSQNTTKLQKAQKYGITIISGEEFYKMVNYDPSQVVEVEEIMKPVIKTPKHIEQYKNFLEFD